MSGIGLVQACPWKFEIWGKVCTLFGSGLIIKCIFKTFLQRPLQTFVIIFIHFNKFGDTVCCGRPLPTLLIVYGEAICVVVLLAESKRLSKPNQSRQRGRDRLHWVYLGSVSSLHRCAQMNLTTPPTCTVPQGEQRNRSSVKVTSACQCSSRSRRVPAGHYILTRSSMSLTSPASAFNVVADLCRSVTPGSLFFSFWG